jgi:hypothetical protein
MSSPKQFSEGEARCIGDSLGIDWRSVDLEQFRMGLCVELEYMTRTPEMIANGKDRYLTGKVALAYLKEHPNYYTRYAAREADADKQSVRQSAYDL